MEFNIILKLEKIAITDKYDKKYFTKLLQEIKNSFSANGCIWYREFASSNKLYKTEDKFNITCDYVTIGNMDNVGIFIIIKPNRSILNSKMIEYLEVYLSNINKLNKIMLEYENKAYFDSLTEVRNNEALLKKISDDNQYKNVGVLFVDVNGLGIVNNMYGHKAGDTLLKTVSMCISSYIKKDDIYRRGGDEFVAICSNISEEDFLEKIELIKNKLFQTEYSASFGYTYSAKTNNIKTLIEIADENMYIDKENYKLNNPSKYKVKRKNNL